MAITRRTFIHTSAGLILANSAGLPLAFSAQETTNDILIIDPHTHIFNATDIPIAGFALKVIPQMLSKIGWLGRALGVLAGMIGKVLEKIAPGYGAENDRLQSWFRDSPLVVTGDWTVGDPQAQQYYEELIAEYQALDKDTQEALEEEFRSDGQRGLSELQTAIAEGDQEASFRGADLVSTQEDFLNQEAPFLAFLELSRKEEADKLRSGAPSALTDDDRSRIQIFGWIPGARLVRQLKRLAQFRYQNAIELMKTYPEVDAFVTASVDFDYWLGSGLARTSTWQQIDLMSKISHLTDGRVLAMVGFNPWSSLEDPQRLQDIKDAVWKVDNQRVTTKGIVGIKLYPPMGFQPIANKGHDNDPSWWPSNAPAGAFGTDLDKQLQEIYNFCLQEDLAIMAHANDSNDAGPDYGKRANPELWHQQLSHYKQLRFSTGHSGGFKKVVNDDPWFEAALDVANDFEHTYMDFSNFDELYRRKNRRKLARAFAKHISVQDKMMYASDWYMLASKKKFRKYLTNFSRVVDESGVSTDVMGANAARYFGLEKGSQTRTRLDSFFPGRNSSRKPSWFAKT